MFERLKYRLLTWLLGDICMRSHEMCYGCTMCYEDPDDGAPGCCENDIRIQARRVWGLEDECTTEQ